MSKTTEQKRDEAHQRQLERDMRSIREQLDVIATRRGASKKEKERLLAQLEKVQNEFHSHGNQTQRR